MIPSFDPILLDFIDGNKYTIGIFFSVLIGLAKVTPWTWDETVLDVIIAPFKSVLDTLSSKKK